MSLWRADPNAKTDLYQFYLISIKFKAMKKFKQDSVKNLVASYNNIGGLSLAIIEQGRKSTTKAPTLRLSSFSLMQDTFFINVTLSRVHSCHPSLMGLLPKGESNILYI